MKKRPKTLRFLDQALASDTDDCIPWPYAKSGDGRGQLMVDGKLVLAHRHVCRMVYGDPPSEQFDTAHSCHNGHLGCINPKHVRWATRKENMNDGVRWRDRRGEKHAQAKLTDNDAIAIRSEYLEGKLTHRDLGKRYGVSHTVIGHIIRRSAWAHL
jgi:hypothetical protein